MSIEEIIISLSYFGILLLMSTNGFISFPSSQILYIICGYFVFTEDLNLITVILIGALGNTIGNIILYEISRRKGIKYILKLKVFPEKEIKKICLVFEKKGAWFLFLGKLLPAIKVFVPIAAGLAKMNRSLYSIIIFITSIIWASIFVSIGFYFGKSNDVFGVYAPILLIISFVVITIFYKYMNSSEIIKEMEK